MTTPSLVRGIRFPRRRSSRVSLPLTPHASFVDPQPPETGALHPQVETTGAGAGAGAGALHPQSPPPPRTFENKPNPPPPPHPPPQGGAGAAAGAEHPQSPPPKLPRTLENKPDPPPPPQGEAGAAGAEHPQSATGAGAGAEHPQSETGAGDPQPDFWNLLNNPKDIFFPSPHWPPRAGDPQPQSATGAGAGAGAEHPQSPPPTLPRTFENKPNPPPPPQGEAGAAGAEHPQSATGAGAEQPQSATATGAGAGAEHPQSATGAGASQPHPPPHPPPPRLPRPPRAFENKPHPPPPPQGEAGAEHPQSATGADSQPHGDATGPQSMLASYVSMSLPPHPQPALLPIILSISPPPPHPQLGAFGAWHDEHPARPSILSKRSQPKLVSQLRATLAIITIAASFSFIVDQSPFLQSVAKAINEPFQYKLVFSAASPPVLPQSILT